MQITENQWNEFLNEIAVLLGENIAASWFSPLVHAPTEEEDALLIMAPSAFILDYIQEHFLEEMKAVCREVIGEHVVLRFAVGVESAVKSAPKKTKMLKAVPASDLQLDMFVPNIAEVPVKDDVHLMEVAPFTLQPRGEDRQVLDYQAVNGMDIKVLADPEHGLITALDYDVVLMMQSWLAELANTYRSQLDLYKRQGRKEPPQKPPLHFSPNVKEILLFARNYERSGLNQRERIEAMLTRLESCKVKIARSGRARRRWGTFRFIDGWEVLEETQTGRILQVKIGIPKWVYEGIVDAPVPTILTYDPDYFLLKQSALRFLYRYLRLRAREITQHEVLDIPLPDLYARSGSRQEAKYFYRDLRKLVDGIDNGQFFDWKVGVLGTNKTAVLRVVDAPRLLANQ